MSANRWCSTTEPSRVRRGSTSAVWPTPRVPAHPSFDQYPDECDGGCGRDGDERQRQQAYPPVLALDLSAFTILDVRVPL